ncbi:MAG: hypothetical protein O3A63_01815 [Proteobacteria bacterium]|nr:hypothetical protein [Pseudomonadota bacterium]
MFRNTLIALLLGVLAGCGQPVSFFDAQHYPAKLSDWGIVTRSGNRLVLGQDVDTYDLNTPLFSDYAGKLRTLWIPPGESAVFDADKTLELPVGTILSKTFFYDQHNGQLIRSDQFSGNPADLDLDRTLIIETRLLVHQPHGWDALPYVWDGADAVLKITGDLQTFEFKQTDSSIVLNYQVPSKNECAGCHATDHTSGENQPIGMKARHLNRPHPLEATNQLDRLSQRGLIRLPAGDLPANARWSDAQLHVGDRDVGDWEVSDRDVAHRARSYLDINCGHCHNPRGAADTSGLMLDIASTGPAANRRAMGVCKPPIASGGGSGGNLYSIVPGKPAQSILSYRMRTTDPADRMPEIGRTLVDAEGVAVVDAWLAGMSGECL